MEYIYSLKSHLKGHIVNVVQLYSITIGMHVSVIMKMVYCSFIVAFENFISNSLLFFSRLIYNVARCSHNKYTVLIIEFQ